MSNGRALLIDVGNTRVKWRYCRHQQLSDELGFVRDDGRFDHQLNGVEVAEVSAIWVSCVAHANVQASISAWAHSHGLPVPHYLVSPEQGYGLVNGYAKPEQLGVDRWLAMLGAWSLQPGACLVVDAGTALTLDVIAAGGRHMGGLIVPGLQLMQRSLLDHTSQIQLSDSASLDGLGRSTTQAVESGSVLCLAALIERQYIISRAQWPGLRCILTGGDAQTLLPHLNADVAYCADLLFRGLQRYAEGSS